MLNIPKDEKRYTEIELDLHKKLAYENGRASMVEELEKIKAEIEEYRNCIPWDKECLIKFEAINYIYENIIWKHISELKGE